MVGYAWGVPLSDPTFEADPIGRRLDCRPKKGLIVINLKFPLAPPGIIKFSLGPRGANINSPWGPWVKNSTFHIFLNQGGPGGAEHPPAR